MNEHRLVVILNLDEADALIQSSEKDYRTPREQVRFVLRKELERLGYLKVNSQTQQTMDWTSSPSGK